MYFGCIETLNRHCCGRNSSKKERIFKENIAIDFHYIYLIKDLKLVVTYYFTHKHVTLHKINMH